jgi:hypothetical protein
MKQTQVCLGLFLLASSGIFLHTQAAAPKNDPTEIPNVIRSMLTSQVFWDHGFDRPAGSHLRFIKKGEETHDGKHFFSYRVFAEGATENTQYLLFVWGIGRSIDQTNELSNAVYINRKGLLMLHKPAKEEEDSDAIAGDSEVTLAFRAAQGEPVRVLIRTKDSKQMIAGTLVPAPVVSTDGPCKASFLRASQQGEAMLLYLDGFAPNSSVTVASTSAGEVHNSEQKTDSNGHVVVVELPFVTGKDAGTVTETIKTNSCTVSVSLPWGNESYQPL